MPKKFQQLNSITALVIIILLFSGFDGCANKTGNGGFMIITSKEAKKLIDSEKDYTILDVRTIGEYDEGHIKDAVLIPLNELIRRAESKLPDKSRLILVYCRSGVRSKQASKTLADMGYTNIKDFGGIIDWPYEVTTD